MRRTLALTLVTTLALALGAFTLAGCTFSSSQANGQAQEHEPLTVCNVNGLFTDDFIAAFQEKHPEVQFEVSAYMGSNGSGYARETLENGEIPDVYVSTYVFSPEAQREQLIDLSGYSFINSYTTTMLNDVDNEGGIYLLPSSFQMVGICYNETIMAEYGWEVPSSFEELKALIPQIEAAGLVPMRCMFNLDGYPFNYFFNIANTEYFHTPEGTQWKQAFPLGDAKAAGNDGLLAGVEYFAEWVDAGLISANDFDAGEEPKEAFLNGECVFFLSLGLSTYENEVEDGTTYEFGVMPWLSADGETNMLTVMVSRYFGLSKELLEPGNEQKLADALALLEYISTPEGQAALVANATTPCLYASPLTGAKLSEDSPFRCFKDLIEQGHTVGLVYAGWEPLITPMAEDIKLLVSGDITPEELLQAFDATYNATVNDRSAVLAVAEEDLSWEETQRLVGIAVGCAADADAALVSLGGYNEEHEINDKGVSWHLYAGEVTSEEVNMIRTKCYSITVLEMTGAEAKALAEGGFDRHGTGNPFPYALVTKGDVELADDEVYRIAVGTEDLVEPMRAEALEVLEITARAAVVDYVSSLGAFSAEDLIWR